MATNNAPRSRLSELLASYPPATLALTSVCVVCYLYTLVDDVNLSDFSSLPYKALYDWQFYRIFTSAFFHGGLMHIAMNMMSFQALGTSLERLFGTTMFFLLNVYIIILSGALYLGVCWLLTYAMYDVSWLAYQSVGYSGVLFALAMLESFLSPAPNRSVFGLITVPTRLYPFVLMVVIQVIMPNISWLGHLSGLLVGLVYVIGKLDWLIPSFEAMQEVEEKECMAPIRRIRGFVPCPQHNPVTTSPGNGDNRSTREMTMELLARWLAPFWRCIRYPLLPLYNYIVKPVVQAVRSVAANGTITPGRAHTNWGGGVLGDGTQRRADAQPRGRDQRQPAAAVRDVEMGQLGTPPATTTAAPASAHTEPPRGSEEPTDAELYDFSDDDGMGDGGGTSGAIGNGDDNGGGDEQRTGGVDDSDSEFGDVENVPLLPASRR